MDSIVFTGHLVRQFMHYKYFNLVLQLQNKNKSTFIHNPCKKNIQMSLKDKFNGRPTIALTTILHHNTQKKKLKQTIIMNEKILVLAI